MPSVTRSAAGLLVALTLGACGEKEAPPAAAGAGTEPVQTSTEHVQFGEALAQIRGHHSVALELYESGDEDGAALHAGHPIAELLHSITSEIDEHDAALSEDLAAALEAGADAIADARPPAEVSSAFESAGRISETALVTVVGDEANEPAFRGSVVAALVATAAHEYEEAVAPKGRAVRLLAEYQDGYAFARVAAELYGGLASDVRAASGEEAAEIDEAFETLSSALPSADPPARLVDALEVESAAELIGHELEETVGAAPVEESDPKAIVEEIDELLDEIASAYANGDAPAAAELAAEAYLENYEVIEAGVIEHAPEVNAELEPLLGADLRRQIQAGASQEEIESMIARARALLDEALEALEGER